MLVIFYFGCSSTKDVTQVQTPPPDVVSPIPPIPWLASTDPTIEVGDPIQFFNEEEIFVSVKDANTVTVLQDGNVYQIDNTPTLFIKIPALTRGDVVKIDRDDYGNVFRMVVRFDYNIGAEEDVSIPEFGFSILESGAFALEGSKQIEFNGKKYNVKVKFMSTGYKDCLLLSNYYPQDRKTYINLRATGVNQAKGTKVVK